MGWLSGRKRESNVCLGDEGRPGGRREGGMVISGMNEWIDGCVWGDAPGVPGSVPLLQAA